MTAADDVDEVVVERACKGDRRIRLTRAELAAAYHRLENRGMSLNGIAATLGVTPRTVARWRNGAAKPTFRRGNK